jgi:hypothetical protein
MYDLTDQPVSLDQGDATMAVRQAVLEVALTHAIRALTEPMRPEEVADTVEVLQAALAAVQGNR